MANFQSYKRPYQEASIDRTMVPTKGTCPSNHTKEQSTHLFVKLVRKKLLACCTNRPNWKSYSKGNTVYKCSAGGAMNTLLPALKWLLEINGWSQLSRLNSADLSQSNIGVKRMSTLWLHNIEKSWANISEHSSIWSSCILLCSSCLVPSHIELFPPPPASIRTTFFSLPVATRIVAHIFLSMSL